MKMSKFTVALIAGVLAAVALAAPAGASFHLLRMNEVQLADGGGSNTVQYIELVDPANEPFPTGSGPYKIITYNKSGAAQGPTTLGILEDNALTRTSAPFANVPIAASTPAAGVGFASLATTLDVTGGTACYVNGAGESKVDCVTWGCDTTVPAGAGSTKRPLPANGKTLARQSGSTWNISDPTFQTTNVAGSAATCSSTGGGGGGGGTPGTGTTPPTGTAKPIIELSGASSSKLKKSLSVTVECPNQACLASAAGTLSVPNASKTFKIKSDSVQIAQGSKATLKIRLSSKARKAAKKALKAGKKVKAKLTITAKNSAGTDTAKTTIKLKR